MDSIDVNKDTIIKRSKVILVGLLFLIVIFAEVVPVTFLFTGVNTSGSIFAWVVIVIGVCIIFELYFFFTNKPLLIASPQGLYLEKIDVITWDNMENLRLIYQSNGRGMTRPVWLQINLKNKVDGKSFVRISTFFFPSRSKKILEILDNYRRAHTGLLLNPLG